MSDNSSVDNLQPYSSETPNNAAEAANTTGPCPVTGGPVCTCNKQKEEDKERGVKAEPTTGNSSDTLGIAVSMGTNSDISRVTGTDGNDIISVRTVLGEATTTVAKGGDDTVILYGAEMLPDGNYHEMLDSLKKNPVRTAKQYFDQSRAHTIRLGTGENDGADTISLISELDGTPAVLAKHTGNDGRINGQGVAGENDQAFDHWAGVFGFVDVVNFDASEDTLEFLGHTTTLGESFTKNGHFFQTVYSEQNANDTSGPRAGAAHDDTFLGLVRFKDGAANAEAIADAIDISAGELYVVDGQGEQVVDSDLTANQTGADPFADAAGTEGAVFVAGKDSDVGRIVGTNGDDIISVRASRGESTTTVTKGGDDTVILYGAEMLPDGNYHEMLDSLKKSPAKTAKAYFEQSKAHTIRLGTGENDGADTISLISELDGTPGILAKHTGNDGRINGRGVAGENDKAFDHWAGVFGFVDVVNFDASEDTLAFRGHTTTLGESFTKNGHFFQTVYSEQNANDTSGPRAGAAHDDTFLGLVRFKNGAANAEAIADAIEVSAMEHYVIDGKGQDVFEGDPTSNQSRSTVFPGPLISFALADADTDMLVDGYENLENNTELDLNSLDLDKYTIVARVNADHPDAQSVESIKFESPLGNRVEKTEPYALFGDIKGNFSGETPETGNFTLKATAYTRDGARGQALESASLDYSIIDSTPEPAQPSAPAQPGSEPFMTFSLVDAVTDQVVEGYEDLSARSTLSLEGLDMSQYNIMASINGDSAGAQQVQSVRFESSLGNRTENVSPYALFGDTRSDFFGRMLETGNFSLKATAYTKDGGKGEAIGSTGLEYAVVETDGVLGGATGVSPDGGAMVSDGEAVQDYDVTLTLDAGVMGAFGAADMTTPAIADFTADAGITTQRDAGNGELYPSDDAATLVALDNQPGALAGLAA